MNLLLSIILTYMFVTAYCLFILPFVTDKDDNKKLVSVLISGADVAKNIFENVKLFPKLDKLYFFYIYFNIKKNHYQVFFLGKSLVQTTFVWKNI